MKPPFFYFLIALSTSVLSANAQVWEAETLRSGIVGAWIRTADFDNDGDPDVAIQAGDSIYWHENLRPGWQPHLIFPDFQNSAFAWVDVLDLDQDGDMDILKAPTDGPPPYHLTWSENMDNATAWEEHLIMDVTGILGWMEGSFGDLDGDGDMDIVLPEYNNGVERLGWLENQGNAGAFTYHQLVAGPHYFSTVSDLDGDGDGDIITGDDKVFWLENQFPDTAWVQLEIVPMGVAIHTGGACSDLNGDGAPELIVDSYGASDKVTSYTNPGWQGATVATGTGLVQGKLGDLDNDGDTDITYGNVGFSGTPAGFGWAENLDDGANWVLHDVAPDKATQRFCTGLADIDGDGDLDMVSLDFNTSTGIGSVFWASNPLISTGVPSLDELPYTWRLSPNPSSDFVNIELESPLPAEFLLLLNDADGRLIHKKTFEKTTCLNTSFDLHPLPAGVYTLTVSTAEGVAVRKIVKQ